MRLKSLLLLAILLTSSISLTSCAPAGLKAAPAVGINLIEEKDFHVVDRDAKGNATAYYITADALDRIFAVKINAKYHQ